MKIPVMGEFAVSEICMWNLDRLDELMLKEDWKGVDKFIHPKNWREQSLLCAVSLLRTTWPYGHLLYNWEVAKKHTIVMCKIDGEDHAELMHGVLNVKGLTWATDISPVNYVDSDSLIRKWRKAYAESAEPRTTEERGRFLTIMRLLGDFVGISKEIGRRMALKLLSTCKRS